MTTNRHQDDALAIISSHVIRLEAEQQLLTTSVVRAYHLGISWRTIGLYLGTSGQAAWSKYATACKGLHGVVRPPD